MSLDLRFANLVVQYLGITIVATLLKSVDSLVRYPLAFIFLVFEMFMSRVALQQVLKTGRPSQKDSPSENVSSSGRQADTLNRVRYPVR